MKRLNKLLMFLSSSTLLIPITLLVACTPSKVVAKPIDDNEFNKLINSIKTETDLLKYADIKFKDQRGSEANKANIIPSQLKNEHINIIFKDKYKGQVSAIVTNIDVDKSNLFAIQKDAKVFVQFTNNKTGTSKTINFVINGLNEKGNFDASGNRVVNDLDYFGGNLGYEQYAKKSQKERFKFDNEKYVSLLKHQVNNGKDINLKEYRGLDTKPDHIKKFDELAEKSNFDTYYNAALKGFTLPIYDSSGQVSGLQVNDGAEVPKGPSSVDSIGRSEKAKTNGLARTIPNETYRIAAIQTFQVNFTAYKDYAKEIEEAQDNIELFGTWNNEQIKSYIETQLRQLTLNYEDESGQIDRELQQTKSDSTSIIQNLNNQKEKLKKEFDEKFKEISNLKKEDLVKWQKKEIEEYRKKSKENKYQTSESGTMWIMDYIDVNKPTKFYFGTNSHVAKAIKDNLVSVSLTRLNSDIKVGETFGLNSFDKNFTRFNFTPKNGKKLNEAISYIFHATDFIKDQSNPIKLLKNEQETKYKGAGLFADFAIVEIDFEKLLDKSNYSYTVWSGSEDISKDFGNEQDKLISKITNNYAGDQSNKVKFVSDWILENDNYKKFDRKLDFNPNDPEDLKKYQDLDSLYILGYPTANEDYYLDKNEDHKQLANKKYDFSLWINSEYKYYKNLAQKEGSPSSFNKYETDKGNFFSYQIGYRSFIDKPGLTDAFISANKVGKKLYSLDLKNDGNVKKYFNYGLEILPRFYAPAGGASGSSVRTKDNKLLAVYHAANGTAKTGLAAAFRSNGYNYNGLFGTYNLGQYDLIYGGGKDQEKDKSYREVMLSKYNGQKSALFPKGFEEKEIPQEFKFTNK
ncbi:Ig-specific serine endopeptidase MIP [Mycoplasma capricolum]|uniref:DUF31 domain-containing protein n=1 Tax=Mycoplasma capricolum subsp. capricolum 14232 TaxID=1188238 RepID=A0A084ESL7_MYCCA|nr:DUF31 family protein [Mycoplasma capricolum]KEZ20959.1 Hypothetical protein, predicted lipoprotein [Mycoplasma capricolum subsp. capricolum 14232]